MARIAGVDLPKAKRMEVALTYIYGIGRSTSRKILQEADLVPSLHRLRVPTLVVCGEFDQATPPALNKLVADKISGARYVELRSCGHCPPLEQPDAFIAAIKDFVGL